MKYTKPEEILDEINDIEEMQEILQEDIKKKMAIYEVKWLRLSRKVIKLEDNYYKLIGKRIRPI